MSVTFFKNKIILVYLYNKYYLYLLTTTKLKTNNTKTYIKKLKNPLFIFIHVMLCLYIVVKKFNYNNYSNIIDNKKTQNFQLNTYKLF